MASNTEYTGTPGDYTNPLDAFRTHSHHFILTVSNTTDAFQHLLSGTSGSQAPVLGMIENVKLGQSFRPPGGNSDIWLLVDTRRYSQYSIIDLEMEHAYGTGDRVNPTVPVSTTKMKLIDTTGLTFFNYMMDIMRNKIKSTRASAFFLLTIVFTGHRDDGTTETVSTCQIPLSLLFMSFEFTSTGSTYDIEFIEIEGAPQRGSNATYINSLGNIGSISTAGDTATVGGMIRSLESQLNLQSQQFYQKYTNDAWKLVGDKGDDKKPLFGKLVQYMITIPEEYANFSLNAAARSKNVEQLYLANKPASDISAIKKTVEYKQAIASAQENQITFSKATTITDAIMSILRCSYDMLELSSEERRKAGRAFAYKTVTQITSDEATYLIHIDVYPYRIPKIEKEGVKTSKQSSAVTNDAGAVKNLITYNYIFTGKNSHISQLKVQYLPESSIALDVDVNLGQSRFEHNAANGQNAEGQKNINLGQKETKDFSPQIRPGDPVFAGQPSINQQKNFSGANVAQYDKSDQLRQYKAMQEQTQTFAMLHFLGSMSLDMTIRGNPKIIQKYADKDERGGFARHGLNVLSSEVNAFSKEGLDTAKKNSDTVQGKIASAKKEYIKEYVRPRIDRVGTGVGDASAPIDGEGTDELLNKIDISTLPVFVKLNILAPNVDFEGNAVPEAEMFTDRFFFPGPYQILFIKTTFSGGEFSHNLTLLPYDVDGSYSRGGDGEPKMPDSSPNNRPNRAGA